MLARKGDLEAADDVVGWKYVELEQFTHQLHILNARFQLVWKLGAHLRVRKGVSQAGPIDTKERQDQDTDTDQHTHPQRTSGRR